MIQPNFLVTGLAALIPLIIGAIWYNPKVFGNAWMRSTGLTEEHLRKANMPLVYGLTLIFSFFIAFSLNFIVIHQFGLMSMLVNEPGFGVKGSEMDNWYMDAMTRYGHNFRTFKHGELHGTITGILLALPVFSILGLFERKPLKWFLINGGFWIICLGLMGGVICEFT